jgi:hypothetical protein
MWIWEDGELGEFEKLVESMAKEQPFDWLGRVDRVLKQLRSQIMLEPQTPMEFDMLKRFVDKLAREDAEPEWFPIVPDRNALKFYVELPAEQRWDILCRLFPG